jgi:plasmid stabilization system protein ParE
MRYDFHPEALEEYRLTSLWYANNEPGLAVRFIEAVEETIRRIVEAPTRWRLVEEDIRRCLTRRFPYGVLYTMEPDRIVIVAVMHCSREPGYWKTRVVHPSHPDGD